MCGSWWSRSIICLLRLGIETIFDRRMPVHVEDQQLQPTKDGILDHLLSFYVCMRYVPDEAPAGQNTYLAFAAFERNADSAGVRGARKV